MPNSEPQSFHGHVLKYEQALVHPPAEGLMRATLDLVDGIGHVCSTGGFAEKGVAISTSEHWYTRAAAALTQFITAEDTRITQTDLVLLSNRKQAIAYIFSASGYRSTRHFVDLVSSRSDDGTLTSDRKRVAVVLASIGLDDVSSDLMDLALAQPAQMLLFLMLGWLNQRAILTAQGERNRGRLLTAGHLLETANVTDREIPSLINAWMYSSYATEPRKHEIKKWFNHLLRKLMSEAGISPSPVSYITKRRPKILVIHERFLKEHAMYRCYAPLLRTLNNRFETVALVENKMADSAADDIFQEVIRLSDTLPNVEAIAAIIQAQEPDIIYYPSLGMSHWTVMVAGLRLAPIQVMTHGHPATSMLDTIDYAYVCELDGDLSRVNSEFIVTGPATAIFEAHSNLPATLPPLLEPSDREVRIAVNSKVMKLSWRLLEICKRLEREALVPVRFSFFPGERFAYMDGLAAAITAELPMATVEPYVDYETFLNKICECDMALAAFPFGNTNSTVDSCLLGLPTVAHFGPESPAQTDRLVLKTAGLPDWLICDNDEDYFNTALRLVNDKSARVDAMAGLSRTQMYENLIGNSIRREAEPFGDVMYQIHRHHEQLQALPNRVMDYTTLLSMDN